MKILQINTVVNTGSTGRIAENIGMKIMFMGWDSTIACSQARKPQFSSSKLIKIGSKTDFLSHVLLTRFFDRHGAGSILSTQKLIREIDNYNPDIIHLHNIHGYYLNIKILFKYFNAKSIPIVWTLHDCWSYTGHCAYYDLIDCNKWKTGCYNCPSISSYPSSWLLDRSKLNYSSKNELFNSLDNMMLVPVSNWLEGDLSHSFLNKYPRKVIHNGLDLSIFREQPYHQIIAKYQIPTDTPIVLGVANVWESRKGLNDFIRLSYELEDYLIILVGLTKKQIKQLPNNVLGISKTDNIIEMAMLYSLSNVFVNPTYEDNFPTTNIEALACGTPVITYNTGGSPEAIDNNTGYVVEKGDINGLTSKIKIVCNHGKSYYKSMCRSRAENLFNKEDRYNEYIELYKEILTIK